MINPYPVPDSWPQSDHPVGSAKTPPKRPTPRTDQLPPPILVTSAPEGACIALACVQHVITFKQNADGGLPHNRSTKCTRSFDGY